MIKKTGSRGFTLIELLVVIAIIGILTAIVIVSINTSRSRGADGGIKKQMLEIRSQTEVYYLNNSTSYTNVCLSGTNNVNAMLVKLAAFSGTTLAINSGAAQTPSTLNCNTSASAYAISVKLKGPTTATYLCIDSVNKTKTTTTPLGANATVCP